MVAEYDGAGAMLARHLHGPDAGADDPLVSYAGSSAALANARFLYPDRLGSIVLRADSAGGSAAIDTYDEYGVPGAANTGRFQYTGQAWIPEIGMYYYKARMLSPTLGRFMQTDPIGYEDQFNLYVYVGNDPVNRADPSGDSAVSVFVKIVRTIVTNDGRKIVRETLKKLPTEKAAVRARQAGKNVVVKGERGSAPTSRVARRIEENASGKENTVRHDAHGESDRPESSDSNSHYQPRERPSGPTGWGHTIYSALAVGTAVRTLSPDAGPIDRGVSQVVDFFNPVADARDALGLVTGEPDQ